MKQPWLEPLSGSPLLIVEHALRLEWEGVTDPSETNLNSPCDYDRACAGGNDPFIISVGHGFGIVIQTSAGSSVWTPSNNGGTILSCFYSDLTDDEVLEEFQKGLPIEWIDSPATFCVHTSPLIAFHAAYSGADMEDHLVLDLDTGSYSLKSAEYDNGEFGLILCSFTKSAPY